MPSRPGEPVEPVEPVEPAGPVDVLVVYVPRTATVALLAALFAAGAGALGDYAECAFVSEGTGQFRPLPGADPAIGEVGRLERVPEHRVELVLPRRLRAEVVAALRAAHPYETPAFHVLEPVEPIETAVTGGASATDR